MTESRARAVLRGDAVVALLVGVLFVLGTWDGLYDTLDIPHGVPAIFVQVGGALSIAWAYLLWTAAATTELARFVAGPSALANALAAAIISAWLIVRDKSDLEVGTQGIVELIVAAVVLAGLAVAEAVTARGVGLADAGRARSQDQPAGPQTD
jgi:hypothetical protein